MGKFEKCTVILPVINETVSLIETVRTIENDCGSDVGEYLFVVCDKTVNESLQSIQLLKKDLNKKIHVLKQKRSFLGGAMQDAFEAARESHTIMMASDLETNPADVKELIRLCKEHPDAIITASRWIRSNSFSGYSPVKLIANFIFQKFFSFLFQTKLSDMTFGFRIFPTDLIRKISWVETRHPFLFESILKPLRLGVMVLEIPTTWSARKEGESQNSFFRNFVYFRTGLKIRFAKANCFLKEEDLNLEVAS